MSISALGAITRLPAALSAGALALVVLRCGGSGSAIRGAAAAPERRVAGWNDALPDGTIGEGWMATAETQGMETWRGEGYCAGGPAASCG